ncbi:MAG: DedA family protein [Anaerolineales bacterium]|nr:DedA family protein [Anaerolineales bacterium]
MDFNLIEIIKWGIDLFLNLDKHLAEIISAIGPWTYIVLFLIIFAETGFVVTPFLPGDSLIFAAASFAGAGHLNPFVILIPLVIAAILGDTVNYWIGHYIGPKVFKEDVKFLKREYLDKTHQFYEKHGGKTIILARFVPIVRTFAPFVAGVGAMTYKKFISYNILGGIAWVSLFTFLGYFFGTIDFVKENFSTVILAIIFISILPAVYEAIKEKRSGKQEVAEQKEFSEEELSNLMNK